MAGSPNNFIRTGHLLMAVHILKPSEKPLLQYFLLLSNANRQFICELSQPLRREALERSDNVFSVSRGIRPIPAIVQMYYFPLKLSFITAQTTATSDNKRILDASKIPSILEQQIFPEKMLQALDDLSVTSPATRLVTIDAYHNNTGTKPLGCSSEYNDLSSVGSVSNGKISDGIISKREEDFLKRILKL
ncbi:hypothetical protein CPB83DRAFT_841020 [Crepidotus variabilis]|uniref:Uncharacterized protein n=1 Tax=Crepidotus variabilis TaxID=179855 RepID=A0A9P6JHV0_9AGAR|nr:hypothetical protein CPB83DRAFT_841020 [Crepidotus variabilis]